MLAFSGSSWIINQTLEKMRSTIIVNQTIKDLNTFISLISGRDLVGVDKKFINRLILQSQILEALKQSGQITKG